jgi:hypothetical protein
MTSRMDLRYRYVIISVEFGDEIEFGVAWSQVSVNRGALPTFRFLPFEGEFLSGELDLITV